MKSYLINACKVLTILACFEAHSQTGNTWANDAFEYRYDDRQRMIASKKPGSEWVYFVYDNRNRLILQQDGNQREKWMWSFTKYDSKDRPVITGLIPIPNAGRNYVQVHADQQYLSNKISGETEGGSLFGYTNNTYPTAANTMTCLTVLYYDSYSWKKVVADTTKLSFDKSLFPGVTRYNSRVSGYTTGARTRILGDDSRWLTTAIYYDNKYRLIQSVNEDHKGGHRRESNQFDFTGRILKTSIVNSMDSKITSVRKEYEYDHAGRLTKIWHQFNENSRVLISSNAYNETGQVSSKKIHSLNATTFLHDLQYRYNIRGWLSSVNGIGFDRSVESRFAYRLLYDQADNTTTPVYNGNISAVKWTNGLSDVQQYGFHYDEMSRLSAASRSPNVTMPKANAGEKFSYDLNGDILGLHRSDKFGFTVDSLNYKYNSGLLSTVDDKYPEKGLFTGASQTMLKYDRNGNLLMSGKSKVTYNHLNLPVEVQIGPDTTIRYVYDALGKKLARTILSQGETHRTDYIGEFQYNDDFLSSMLHDEGRIVFDKSGNGEYQYFLKDHLGSVRMILTPERKITTTTATMELGSRLEENSQYLGYEAARKIDSRLFNHSRTFGASYSVRLDGTPNERYGLAKSLQVMPGDTVKASVYVKYINPDQSKWSDDIALLVSSFVGLPGVSANAVDGIGSLLSNLQIPASLFQKLPPANDGVPRAYLNFLLFDAGYKLTDLGCVPVTSEAEEHGQHNTMRLLEKQLTFKQPGYLYLYLSNDNVAMGGARVEVFFDDFEVEHKMSSVVQVQDFYPSGALLNIAGRDDANNQFGFNGKEGQPGSKWLDFGARMYDPSIARWNSSDPHADNYPGYSAYQFGLNNPLNVVDPDGKDIFLLIWFSQDDETGHSGIAIENYKTQNKKDANGNDVVDKDGNVETEQVKDGTFTYYDLWPKDPVPKREYDVNVPADYTNGRIVNNLSELTNTDVTNSRTGNVSAEGRAADGVVKISTSYSQDEKAKTAARHDANAIRDYNGSQNNCSTFAQRVLNAALGSASIDSSHLVIPTGLISLYYSPAWVVAPNNLYNSAMSIAGATNVKGPASVVAKPFLSYFGK